MSTTCTRCDGTGFLNIDQVPELVGGRSSDAVMDWLNERNASLAQLGGCSCHINPPCSFCTDSHDVQVCDCCGDGEGHYGVPGEHYNDCDPKGPSGPYADNGGLCKCH